MRTKKNKNFNVRLYRDQLIYNLRQWIDGAIFQGNRAIDASSLRTSGCYLPYEFCRERFEIGLYINCLFKVENLVHKLRTNQDAELRFDNLQPIKDMIDKNIDKKLLLKVRNAWEHPEGTLLGNIHSIPGKIDVVNKGLPLIYWIQKVNDEILLSDKQCATHDEHRNIIWLTKDKEHISVQKSVELLCKIRDEMGKIAAGMNV